MGLLHWACERGHLSLARVLLALGANPNAQDAAGLTPLHHAALDQSPRVVSLLLSHGAQPNIVDYAGNTPLNAAMAAVEFSSRLGNAIAERFGLDSDDVQGTVTREGGEVAVVLRQHGGVESRPPTEAELDEIWRAGGDRDMAKVKQMIAANPGIVNGRHPVGSTIHLAIFCNNMEFVELLLSYGADPNARDAAHGLTALGLVRLGREMDTRGLASKLADIPAEMRHLVDDARKREPSIASLIRRHGGR